MQIYFHSRLCSYLPRVPILVEGTVYDIVINVLHFCFELRALKMTSRMKLLIAGF